MRRKMMVYLIVILLVVGAVAVAATPKIVAVTASPQFCNMCHVMNEQYETWFMTGVHRTIKCVDCHLPNDQIINHFIWKGIDGTKDLIFFHTGLFEEPIEISNRNKKFIKANCIRCHDGVVSMIETDGQDCWSCHRRINHKAAIFNSQQN